MITFHTVTRFSSDARLRCKQIYGTKCTKNNRLLTYRGLNKCV